MKDLYVNARMTIPESELTTTATRSSGPGGQNVNKVNSKITLRWSPRDSAVFDPAWRARFLTRYGSRLTREGELVLQSGRYRDQPQNLADVRSRLVSMLLECREPAKPRRKTRPTAGSRRRRREAKTQQSEKKKNRRLRYD
ncbi:MAG: alternative ribosome rescue aminoacyl-tRNA hydrolase ArfB [Planctomycetota bacterium]